MWWAPFTFEESKWYLWHLGGAEIGICRNGKAWQGFCGNLRWENRGTECSGPVQGERPSQAALLTNVLKRKTAALKPFLPEQPFLVNLGGIKLFPNNKIALNLELPPLLHLAAEKGGAPDIIFNFAPFILKETWYGKNTMEGVLCFSLPANTAAPCDLAVHCSLTIYNKTKNVLELDKLPLYGSVLSVYEKNGRLFSDSPNIDALDNNFYKTVDTSKNECGALLTSGNKNDPSLILQGTRIIKNITGF